MKYVTKMCCMIKKFVTKMCNEICDENVSHSVHDILNIEVLKKKV